MKTINKMLLVLVGLLMSVPAFAQTAPTFTTTAAAILSTTTTATINISLTSTTGISATVQGEPAYLLIDAELFAVDSVPASGTVTVRRAQRNTLQTPHTSGAYAVFGFSAGTQWTPRAVGSPTFGVFLAGGVNPVGGCTLTSQQYSPVFVLNPPSISGGAVTVTPKSCNGGVWTSGSLASGGLSTPVLASICTVPIGTPAYGSMGTDTTTGTTSEYTASIYVPYTTVLTGLTNLNGSAVNTGSKKVFILRDSAGRRIAWTALAGTAASGNDAFQAIAFTTPVIVNAGRYYVALQDDTADVAGIRTIATATYNGVYAGVTTSVFGTVAAAPTPPTTFTADQGPIMCGY